MRTFLVGVRARVRSLRHGLRSNVDREMADEFGHHIELRAEDLVRRGVAPGAALRQAREEFGHVPRYMDEARASRGLRVFDRLGVSWLDFKLGWRMLRKYPGLTLVGGIAMAFAIWVGAGAFEIVTQIVRPTLPLPQGDRIVAIRLWDAAANRDEDHALHDLARWRQGATTLRDLGAYRTVQRNLIISAGSAEPVAVAEMTASGFTAARTSALLGRTFGAADDRPGAPLVAVLGHDVWRTRFGADPGVIGRTVRLGSAVHTVVGVMPEGFAWPVSHGLWVPLQLDAVPPGPRDGPRVRVFARLADGASLADARTELATIGQRLAVELPQTHARLRPQVLPYARSVVDVSSGVRLAGAMSLNVPPILLIVLICSNVALLMFARAATRESELVVRNALGASRGRLTMQLFAEALVLGGVAALVGLLAAGAGLGWLMRVVEGDIMNGSPLPFWFRPRLSPATIVYAIALTLLAAVIAGVVPARKVTRGLGSRLRQASSGGGGLQFGGVWTAVIVAQLAVTVALPVVVWGLLSDRKQIEAVRTGFPDQEYLTARVEVDRHLAPDVAASRQLSADSVYRARVAVAMTALRERVDADPMTRATTIAERLPRQYHPHRLIDVDAGGAAPLDPDYPGYRVAGANVGLDFHDAFQAPLLAGRAFHAGDTVATARTVIVNESFVQLVLGGRSPIGRKLRYTVIEEREPRRLEKPSEWYEIVGVVRDLGMADARDSKRAGIYHAVGPSAMVPAQLVVRFAGSARDAATRLREHAVATDPSLRLYEVRTIAQSNEAELEFLKFWIHLMYGATGITLALALAGLYAVMSFTVARRTREIGIRVALGAPRRRVVLGVLRRPLIQLVIGVGSGGLLLVALFSLGEGDLVTPKTLAVIAAHTTVMGLVCLLACIIPARRALAVQPTEALRVDG